MRTSYNAAHGDFHLRDINFPPALRDLPTLSKAEDKGERPANPKLNIPEPENSEHESQPSFKPQGPRGLYKYKEHLFESKSEAACAALLEKYVPGFKVEVGKTFQIQTGDNGRSRIDFKLGNILIEYHPTNLIHEFGGPTAYRKWERSLWRLSAEERAMRISEKVQSIGHRYELHRKELIDGDPKLRNCELLVAHSPEEFYHKVIKRFGRNVPDEDTVVDQFFDVIRDVRRVTGQGYKKAPRKDAA